MSELKLRPPKREDPRSWLKRPALHLRMRKKSGPTRWRGEETPALLRRASAGRLRASGCGTLRECDGNAAPWDRRGSGDSWGLSCCKTMRDKLREKRLTQKSFAADRSKNTSDL